jgi:hypothetical protein
VIVRLDHLSTVPGFSSRPGLCRRGARAWFDRYGLDWNAFRYDGIDSKQLLATGDAFALAVVAHVANLEEASRGR